jgi:hypothetical protein
LGKKRFAVAVADGSGSIIVEGKLDEAEALDLVRSKIQPKSLILLDVPMDGCENLKGGHFRPIERAVMHQGAWLLLADRWLAEQLGREVQICNSRGREYAICSS